MQSHQHTQMEDKENASFSLMASGDRSFSLQFLNDWIGEDKTFFNDAIGDFLPCDSASATSDSPKPCLIN